MANNKILIRVDGNSQIGLGHIYRGIALAEMLKSNYRIEFVIRKSSTSDPITNAGFKASIIPDTTKFLEEPNYIVKHFTDGDVIVLDGYDFDENYQVSLKILGISVVYVDDLVSGEQKSDLVINHSPDISIEQYKKEPYTKVALGLKYSLIRPVFVNYNRSDFELKQSIKNVLILFGGADPLDFTYKAVRNLIQLGNIDNINVVLGGAYIHEKIFNLTDERIRIHRNLSEVEIFEVMQSTDVAITPASTTSIELASIGVPMILGYFIENQIGIYNGFMNKSSVVGVGDFNEFNFEELDSIILRNNDNIREIQISLLSMFEGDIKSNIIEKFQAIC